MQNDQIHGSIESDQTNQSNLTFQNHLYSQHHSIEEQDSLTSINQIQNNSISSFESKPIECLKSFESSLNEESFEINHNLNHQIISKILCLDLNGKILPYNFNQIKSLQSVWNLNNNHFNHHFNLINLKNHKVWFNEENQKIEFNWIKDLKENVLFNGSKLNQNQIELIKEEEEENELVFEIQQNLRSLVNELNQDQWLYPSPTAFSPSLSIQSNSLNLGLEGTSNEIINHERYLETEFNLHSLPLSFSEKEKEDDLFLPPRQLWLGEEEDKGLESDISLIDLLNTTPTTQHYQSGNKNRNHESGSSSNQSHLFRRNLFQKRHAQSSALARES